MVNLWKSSKDYAEIKAEDETVSVNVTVLPLQSGDDNPLGVLIMLEDISGEKRVKSTLSRYMDPDVADQLLSGGDGVPSVAATHL